MAARCQAFLNKCGMNPMWLEYQWMTKFKTDNDGVYYLEIAVLATFQAQIVKKQWLVSILIH